MVDRAYFYDNSVDDTSPRLIFRVKDGEVVKEYGEHVQRSNKVKNWGVW
jgi:hypothetical protein